MTRRARSVYRSNIRHPQLREMMLHVRQVVFGNKPECYGIAGSNSTICIQLVVCDAAQCVCDVPVEQSPKLNQFCPGFRVVVLPANPFILFVAGKCELAAAVYHLCAYKSLM